MADIKVRPEIRNCSLSRNQQQKKSRKHHGSNAIQLKNDISEQELEKQKKQFCFTHKKIYQKVKIIKI